MEKEFALENYADNCVEQTVGWNCSWINDRILPRRPWAYQPHAIKVDQLIKKHLPTKWERIGVEEGNYWVVRDEEGRGNMDRHNNAAIKGGTNQAGCLIVVSVFITLGVKSRWLG
jgi:hypothetical protein